MHRGDAQELHMPGAPGKAHVYENALQEPFNEASVSHCSAAYSRGPESLPRASGVCVCNSSRRDRGAFPPRRHGLRPPRTHTHHSDLVHQTLTTLRPTAGGSRGVTDRAINQESHVPGCDRQPGERRADISTPLRRHPEGDSPRTDQPGLWVCKHPA